LNGSRIDFPAALADLVQYQDGAVVSQTLVKAETGTVTVFAFDAGEGLSEHTAPFDALLLIVDGRATVTIGDAEHTLVAGEIVRLPANIPHALRAVERFKMLLTMVREG
jgi:quercetin dioxygenase-like cupin family protein